MSKRKKNRNRRFDANVLNQDKDCLKYCLWIVRVGIVVCLFLPLLIVHSHIFAMQVGKVLAFRAIIETIAFFYLVLAIKREEYRPKWGLFEISITLFLFVYFLTSLGGINFLRSFWGTSERMGGFFTLLHFWAYFIMLTSVFRTVKEWRFFARVSVFVAMISSLYAFGQSAYFYEYVLNWLKRIDASHYNFISTYVTEKNFVIIDNWRPFGTIGNAGLFAGYVLINLFWCLHLLLAKEEIKKKFIYFIILATVGGGLFVSGTRSSLLAIIAGFVSLGFVYMFLSVKKKNKIYIGTILAITVIFVGYVFWDQKSEIVRSNFVLTRLASVYFESDKSRIWTWESSWNGFLENPVLGVGPENYNIVFNKYFNPLHFTGYGYGSVTWYDKPHNIFLELLTTMGIIGFLSYMGIFFVIYWFLIKNRGKARENLPAYAVIASFPVAYFVQNMFWFDDFSSYLMLFLFFAFASNFFNNELKYEYNVEIGKKITNKISNIIDIRKIGYWILDNKKIATMGIGMTLIMAIYHTNIKAWKFHDLTSIAVAAFSKNADDSFLWYKEAMNNSTYLGRQELYKRFGNFVNAKYVLTGSENLEQKEMFKRNMKYAISEMENAVKENDKDVQFYSLLGALQNKYYSNFKEAEYIEKAEKTLQKAIELSPERETVYYEYGQTMVFKKDYKKAIELFKKGVDLNPAVPVSHWYLGMAYLNAGEYNLADVQVRKAYELGYGYKTKKDILSIVPIYIELKDYVRLESLYLDLLDLDPNSPETYVSLAIVYKEKGDKISAIKMAEKAISLDESYRVEGNKFIESLGK